MLDVLTDSALSMLITLGYRTGLFEAAARGPATSDELAERSGLQERYVREWLGAMVTAGFFALDPTNGRCILPTEHAVWLTGSSARNLAPMTGMVGVYGGVLAELEQCFRDGGGVPSASYPALIDARDDLWRPIYDEHLINGFLGAVTGLAERLAAGVQVLDIGCGAGHAVNLMASAYPRSRFVGVDIAPCALAQAAKEAAAMGLSNAAFNLFDATELAPMPPYDVITAFDVIHDLRAPDIVLRRVHDALQPDGFFIMLDLKFSSQLEYNIGNPFAPLYYGISLMHCMTISLAQGGAGLGAVWGQELATEMVTAAGFTSVDVRDVPRPQNCIYVCRRAS
ncbi:MAG: class I SAM-dependent methyltransferase [Pseudonocardiaceae bacterium]